MLGIMLLFSFFVSLMFCDTSAIGQMTIPAVIANGVKHLAAGFAFLFPNTIADIILVPIL
ncbi:MAG: hypothetical protein MJ168_04840 [Clostridia bacterium]|nr:hypothetical protein [Clostridia bacterium]